MDRFLRFRQVVVSGAILIVLIGCLNFRNHDETGSPTTTSIPTETTARFPSETETLSTSRITETETPSGLNGNTQTPNPSTTLTGKEIEETFIQLIGIIETCPLPCWWGLKPGESMLEDLYDLASPLGLSVSKFERENGVSVYEVFPLSFDNLFNRVAIFDTDEGDSIEWIWVNGQTRFDENYSPKPLLELWASFSPENILRDFGPPSDVRIGSVSHFGDDPQPEKFPYWIGFYYREHGFFIRYEGMVENSPIYQICPTTSNTGNLGRSIGIFIQDPTSQMPLEELYTEITGAEFNFESNKLIEDIIDYSPEELISLYMNDETICFDVPQSTWP